MRASNVAIPMIVLMVAGCARNLEPPEIPVYHPANASAVEAPRIEAFDVLAVTPAVPPELPVTEGVQQPPQDPEKMGGMHGDQQKQGMEHTEHITHTEHMDHTEHTEHTEQTEHTEHMHGQAAPSGTAPHELQGVVEREGMRSGMPEAAPKEGFPTDHPPAPDHAYRKRLDDEMKHGDAHMEPIKIPTEQRGMGADSTLYHEHKHHDSTHITHPNRHTSRQPIVGPHAWVCPMHPEVVVATPGGRCPDCDTVLVPVKVDE